MEVLRGAQILEGGPKGLADKLDVVCERKGRLKEVSKFPDLSKWKNGGAFAKSWTLGEDHL